MHQHLARVRRAPVFPDVDALPSTEPECAAGDRDRQARGGERSADVAGHVVGAFGGVRVVRIALGNVPRHPRFEIVPRGGVGVFLNDQARGGVTDEDRAQAFDHRPGAAVAVGPAAPALALATSCVISCSPWPRVWMVMKRPCTEVTAAR